MGKLMERFGALGFGTQLAVSLVILALIGGGYFYKFYLPKREELAKATEKLKGLEQKVAESRKAAAQLPQFKEDVARLNQELLVALAQLPEKKEVPDLLAQVSRAGQDSGLEVLLFQPGPEKPVGLYAEVPVSMKANGSFHQMLSFFDRVSRLPRIVTIGDVSFTDAKDHNGRLVLAASFSATAYRFVPEAQAAPAARGARGGPPAKPGDARRAR